MDKKLLTCFITLYSSAFSNKSFPVIPVVRNIDGIPLCGDILQFSVFHQFPQEPDGGSFHLNTKELETTAGKGGMCGKIFGQFPVDFCFRQGLGVDFGT